MSMRSIYLAAAFGRRYQVRAIAERLRALGHTVVSTWHDKDDEQDGATNYQLSVFALADIEELNAANSLVLFSEPSTTTTHGRQVEFGYALAKGMALFLIGPPENIFHTLPHVFAVASMDELLAVWG